MLPFGDRGRRAVKVPADRVEACPVVSPQSSSDRAAWRVPAATLGEMPSDRVSITPDTRVSEVERMLLSDPTIRSVLLEVEDEIVCIDRAWFFSTLSGPLGHGRSLYARHQITRMPRPQTLVLPAEMSLVDAASAILDRQHDVRYNDIVVRSPGGIHATILVANLFAEVAHTHAYVGLHDPLTSLPNRRMFLERLQDTHIRTSRNGGRGGRFAVLFVDLDDFKPINDVLGHQAGDIALRTAAERLRSHPDPHLTVARLGGDEFGVLLERRCSEIEVAELSAWMIDVLSEPIQIEEATVMISASVGFALADDESTADELLRMADMAMYAAKRNGKNRYSAYLDGMHARASRRLELRSQISGAIDRAEFKLEYQPVVELKGGSIVGAEALLRWERPGEGLVGPDQFIPLSEQTGLIVPLGAWVLQEACTRARAWALDNPHHAGLSLAVNVSPRQLEDPAFVDTVARILRLTEITPSALTLEITENVLIKDLETVLGRLAQLRRLGVRLALDDFGAGFSSLGYLSRMPIDILKLDRRFVSQLGSTNERGMLSGIVKLAESLDLVTVAEGVETDTQLRELRVANCRLAQGYLFARPMSDDALQRLLAESMVAPTAPAMLAA
jgi:diguanylate cyclase (GGDEF)-like protein